MGCPACDSFDRVLNKFTGDLFLQSGDCWPRINATVEALRIAATRAVTFAWNEESLREQEIRALTTQLDNCVNGSNFRQREFDACRQELAFKNTELQAAQRELTTRQQLVDRLKAENARLVVSNQQLTTANTVNKQHIATLNHQVQVLQKDVQNIGQQKDQFWRAEKARQEAGLQREVQTLTNENRLLTHNAQELTNTVSRLTADLQHCRAANAACDSELNTVSHENKQLRARDAVLVRDIEALTAKLQACEVKAKQCEGEVVVIGRQYKQCQNQIRTIAIVIRQLEIQHNTDLVEIDRWKTVYEQCKRAYAVIIINYNHIQTILRKCEQQHCPPCSASACRTIDGSPGVCTGACVKPKATH